MVFSGDAMAAGDVGRVDRDQAKGEEFGVSCVQRLEVAKAVERLGGWLETAAEKFFLLYEQFPGLMNDSCPSPILFAVESRMLSWIFEAQTKDWSTSLVNAKCP